MVLSQKSKNIPDFFLFCYLKGGMAEVFGIFKKKTHTWWCLLLFVVLAACDVMRSLCGWNFKKAAFAWVSGRFRFVENLSLPAWLMKSKPEATQNRMTVLLSKSFKVPDQHPDTVSTNPPSQPYKPNSWSLNNKNMRRKSGYRNKHRVRRERGVRKE